MNRRHALIGGGAALAALIGIGGWLGYSAWQGDGPQQTAPTAVIDLPDPVAPGRADQTEVVTLESDTQTLLAGATPMAERVAVLGLLNKRNGESRDLTLRPGQAVRLPEGVIVRLRACERTAPWEPEQYTGAFVQLDIRGADEQWRRAFSGWLYRERPALNVVPHPIWDVWPKSCTMSFPDTGPDTVVMGSDAAKGGASPRRSSASNEAETEATPPSSPAVSSPSAEPSNAI
jgi:hypothetical protein